MNSSPPNTESEDCCIPVKEASPSLNPIPVIDNFDDEIHVLRAPSYDAGIPAPLPDKNHSVLDVGSTVVSSSVMRRIELELRNNEYDLRTVFSSCRGLTKGSLEFEEAYIAARIRSFAKKNRLTTDPLVVNQSNEKDWPVNSYLPNMNEKNPQLSHPMAVNHLGHLMSHFGIWVIGLLGIQFFAAWRISAFVKTYLEGGQIFYFSITIFLFLVIDSVVWFRRRGNLSNAFLLPGTVLFLMALLPVFILHVREVILALQ